MKSKFTIVPLLFVMALFVFPNFVFAADADLLIESVSFEPAQPLVDQTTKIIVKVKYTGSSSLTSNLSVNNLAFSHKDFKQTVTSENGPSVNPSTTTPLYSGSYFTYTIVGKFTSVGVKSLVLKIDGANKLSELNENNNTNKPKVTILKFGDLIKLANDSAVYLIKSDGKKHLFVNGPTFWSYYRGTWNALRLDDWTVYIQEISQSAFDSIPTGKNIVVKSGARLIKFQNSAKVYTVFGDSKIKQISDQLASTLYGSGWKDKVITIQNGFEADYAQTDEDFKDTDNDGLSDDDEKNIYHTDPSKADTDGDSYKDGSEVLNNYNPNT